MKNNLNCASYIIALIIILFAGPGLAQMPAHTGPASAEQIKKAMASVEAAPNDPAVHKTYIYAMGINNPLLVGQYRLWMKKYPESVNIPLTIGTIYYNAEMPQAKEFLLKASTMEPQNANLWFMLSIDAERWGQKDLSIEYMRKATVADPSYVDYACNYLMSFQHGDSVEYKKKVFDFLKRFPTSERGSQVLYWLGERATNVNDKIFYFEELHKLYPPQKFSWSSAGMIGLTDTYIQTAPDKALTLIDEMGEGDDWKIRKQVAESLIRVNKLEQDHNYKDALTELNRVRLPGFNYINDFIALKKASLQEKTGDVKAAYDSLSLKFAKLPTDQLYVALQSCGEKIGKDKNHIAKDIQTIRNAAAVPAYPFELQRYTGNGKLNLNDLKGKVVLLTFWFPGCGPCSAEFPHFQSVINEFNGEDVIYIGINIEPTQDNYVIPFIENSKYSFTPLRGNSQFAAKYYGVRGVPKNFLIDKEGRIVFKNFRIDNTNQRTLELMISSLIQEGRNSE